LHRASPGADAASQCCDEARNAAAAIPFKSTMPRYYFHLSNLAGFTEDEEGSELDDEEAARERAVASARELLAAETLNGAIDLTAYIEVEDEARSLLFTLSFTDALEVRRQR
jgi:hypothetical protein